MDGMVAYDSRAADGDDVAAAGAAAPPVAVMQAQQEELGDLKLYRIPEPVTVAARSQKQVALLQRPGVQVRTVYRARFYGNASPYGGPAQRAARHPQPRRGGARPAAARGPADAVRQPRRQRPSWSARR